MAGLDTHWRGLSITMPLKVAVLDLGLVDEVAHLAGAGNTLIFDDDARRVHNTDVGGLVSAVRRISSGPAPRVTILGTGATARSALVSAAQLGAEQVTVVARTPSRGRSTTRAGRPAGTRRTRAGLGAPLPEADLVISTAVAGAADAIAPAIAASAPLIFDAIYDPWPTELASVAARAGCTVINGLDLLIGQALLQIELMTGRTVPAATLYAALPTDLSDAQRAMTH